MVIGRDDIQSLERVVKDRVEETASFVDRDGLDSPVFG
jgi:hypothetical protein